MVELYGLLDKDNDTMHKKYRIWADKALQGDDIGLIS